MASGGYSNIYDNNSNNYRPLYYDSLFLSAPRFPPLMPTFQQYPPLLLRSPANLVRIVNNFENGKCSLKEILKFFDAREEEDKRQIEELLQKTVINFEITRTRISTGLLEPQFEQSVQVFTKLKLCSYHCKKGKDGRNKKCNNKCGALHLCRTFLLKSSEECHFSKKGQSQCMFGHDFNSEHNWKLLKEHHLDMLNQAELRQLFRRPNSRCSTTIPQVCRYYNSKTERKCTNKHCMSLHICLEFILDKESHETCNKNHSFKNDQVKKCLDLFEIKTPWTTEDIFTLVHQFTRKEKPSDSDEIASGTSDLQSNYSRRSSLSVSSDIFYPNSGEERSQDRCHGCTELLKDFNLLKEEVTALKLEVEKLKQGKQGPQATHARVCPISGLPI